MLKKKANCMIEKILNPIKTGLKMLSEKPITYNFPPDMPLTEGFRGRHVYDPEKCKGCSLCAKICPNNAIEMVEREKDGKKVLQPQVDYSKCCFCGLCVDVCPTGALKLSNFPFLVVLDKNELLYPPEKLVQLPKLEMGKAPKIKNISSWARSRSFWVLNYFTGCCFIEAIPWVSSGFDMERFGLIAVGSPRIADVLLIGGYVTIKTLKRILRVYQQMPRPKYVIALGNCPMSGGTYWDSYNTIKRLDKYLPVDIWIAGCPPRAEAIGLAVVMAIHAVQSGYTGKKEEVTKKGDLLKLPEVKTDLEEKLFVPFGPQHPGSGNFNMLLKLDGEVVEEAIPNPGYLHRGFEKLMEYRSWWQNIMIVQRVCVLDGASYELGYIGAVEKIAGLDAPRRAKYLRVIQAELSRMQSHLLNIGLVGATSGFDTVARIAWGDREKVLLLLEKLTGSRIYSIYNIPGGVRRDMPSSFKDDVLKFVKYFEKRMKTYDELCFDNEAFIERTKRLGRLTRDQAIDLDVTGPNLRATGARLDVRKATPYEAYDELDFNMITLNDGDAYSRVLCRRKEIEESLRILENALDKIPSGPIANKKTKSGKIVSYFTPLPKGEALHFVESARGELCFHIVSDGGKCPYRVKIRGPTFDTILVALPKILKGVYVADIPVIYWSLDNCPADHDR